MLGVALGAPLCLCRSCPLIDIVTTCGDSCELLTLASSSCQDPRPPSWRRNARGYALQSLQARPSTCSCGCPTQHFVQLPSRQRLARLQDHYSDCPGFRGSLESNCVHDLTHRRRSSTPRWSSCADVTKLQVLFSLIPAKFAAPVSNNSSPRKSETSAASNSTQALGLPIQLMRIRMHSDLCVRACFAFPFRIHLWPSSAPVSIADLGQLR